MTGSQRKRRVMLLTGVLVLLTTFRLGGSHRAQAHSLGGMREQRLIDRSVPLCQTVAPMVARQTLSVEYATPDYLSIASRDAAGREVASVTWEFPREAIFEVTGALSDRSGNGKQLLSGPTVVWKTRAWLRSLGLVSNIHLWRPTGAPIALQRHRWAVNWTGEGRRAVVQIDDRSGALYRAILRDR